MLTLKIAGEARNYSFGASADLAARKKLNETHQSEGWRGGEALQSPAQHAQPCIPRAHAGRHFHALVAAVKQNAIFEKGFEKRIFLFNVVDRCSGVQGLGIP